MATTTAAILTTPLLVPGEYTLLIEGFSTRSGNYTVTMSSREAAHATLAAASEQGYITCGEPATGSTAHGVNRLGGQHSPDHTYQFEVGTPAHSSSTAATAGTTTFCISRSTTSRAMLSSQPTPVNARPQSSRSAATRCWLSTAGAAAAATASPCPGTAVLRRP